MLRLLVLVIILGLVAWLIKFLPIGEPFITIIWVIIVLVIIWEVLALAGYTKSFVGNNRPMD
jgi:hypothetical protein